MNPLLQSALGAILRWGLTFVAGFFVQKGIWSSEEAVQYVAALSVALLALGWSLWQKYHAQLKLLVAMGTPGRITEKAVEEQVSSKIGVPPISTPKSEIPERRSETREEE